jgi:hypothetical protein
MRTIFSLILLSAISFSSYAQAIIGKMYTVVPDFVKVYGVDKQERIHRNGG